MFNNHRQCWVSSCDKEANMPPFPRFANLFLACLKNC